MQTASVNCYRKSWANLLCCPHSSVLNVSVHRLFTTKCGHCTLQYHADMPLPPQTEL